MHFPKLSVYIFVNLANKRTRDVSQFPVISPPPTCMVHIPAFITTRNAIFSTFTHELYRSFCVAFLTRHCVALQFRWCVGDNPVAVTLLGGLKFQRICMNPLFIIQKLHICSIQAEEICSVVCWHLQCTNRIIPHRIPYNIYIHDSIGGTPQRAISIGSAKLKRTNQNTIVLIKYAIKFVWKVWKKNRLSQPRNLCANNNFNEFNYLKKNSLCEFQNIHLFVWSVNTFFSFSSKAQRKRKQIKMDRMTDMEMECVYLVIWNPNEWRYPIRSNKI